MTYLKPFNVYQVLLENIKDEDIYKDIELPPVNILDKEEQYEEDFECYGGCGKIPNEYYLNLKDEPLCKNCYIVENYDFIGCYACDKAINGKNSIIFNESRFSIQKDYCLGCSIKNIDEESLPKVCQDCYVKLEEIVKEKLSKLDKISEFSWEYYNLYIPYKYLISCDNCGTLCSCYEAYKCNNDWENKCYDCLHPEERDLRIKFNLLEEENKQLKKEIEMLKLHIKYQPNGEGAQKALKHFSELVNNTK